MPPTKKPAATKPARKRKAPAKKPAAAKKKAAPKRAAGDATRARRLEHKRKAAEALEKHSGPVLGLLSEVVADLAEENGIATSQTEEDFALIGELAHRLDKAIELKDPLFEAISDVVIFFLAAGAVAIYRSIERRSRMQGKRLDRLRKKLEDRGPLMSKLARERLEKRIARLAAK